VTNCDRFGCNEITNLTMRVIKIWALLYAESTSDRMNRIVDFTNIIETSSTNNKGSTNY
jgi:hypothetical protein